MNRKRTVSTSNRVVFRQMAERIPEGKVEIQAETAGISTAVNKERDRMRFKKDSYIDTMGWLGNSMGHKHRRLWSR